MYLQRNYIHFSKISGQPLNLKCDRTGKTDLNIVFCFKKKKDQYNFDTDNKDFF